MRHFIYLVIAFSILGCTNQQKDTSEKKKEKNLPENFDFGKAENGIYTNNYFRMQIKYNPDWIVQSKEQTQNLIEVGGKVVSGNNRMLQAAVEASKVNTAFLLSIFKFEVGSAVDFNPSFIAIAENTKKFPGIKNGKDYLFHTKKALKQTALDYQFTKEAYHKRIGNSNFYAMESKPIVPGQDITQEYMTTVTKGFSLTFIISYSNEDEKAELYQMISDLKI